MNGLARWLEGRRARLEGAAAVAVTLFVIAHPFAHASYPPMTDLPFHAAHTSILRHYFDDSFHFREQFVVGALEAPYFLMYALGAALALALPLGTAVKLATIAMLALLPAGVAVLFHGMKKSPVYGVLATGLVWTTLTHWGFLSFLGAVGLFAMTIGLVLRVCDSPTRGTKIALACVLVTLLFTHVYRFPFAILAIALGAALFGRRTWRDLALSAAPGMLLFASFLVVRPPALAPSLSGMTFDLARLREVPEHVYGAFGGEVGAMERKIGLGFVCAVAVVAMIGLRRGVPRSDARFAGRSLALVLGIAGVLVLAYLVLPLTMKGWFFVYPREITTAGLILLALVPDLPSAPAWRAAALAVGSAPAVAMTLLVSAEWRRFEEVTRDFREVKALVPPAPRLLHLVFDHRDTHRTTTPFIHLPAWIQAEKGGWLYFHFVRWGMYPMRYRFDGGIVPPLLPHGLEWEPQNFRVLEHGPWFDTFLVRHESPPDQLFAEDRAIVRVANRGKWWLYRRH